MVSRPDHRTGLVRLLFAGALLALPVFTGAFLIVHLAKAQAIHPGLASSSAPSSSALTERDLVRMLPPQQVAQASVPDENPHTRVLPTGALSTDDFKHLLPATNMRSGQPASPHGHGFTNGPATPFDSAGITANPLAPDAIAIGAKSCVACHSLEHVHASHSLHVASFSAVNGATSVGPDGACEACHGPGSAHAKQPTKPGLIIAFTRDATTPIAAQTGACLACHKGGARQDWAGSIHQQSGLGCTDCHNPMARLSPEGVLANHSVNQVCASCHQDIRSMFNRRSHMPLPEGQMSCVDCHNPHGTLNASLIKTDTVNQTCYTCHAEKRGPFLFEHAPVRESCLNCHDPHGSNNQTLLVLPLPMLCQQCHTMTRHPNDLQTIAGLATGQAPDERLIGRACISCHTNIHGSNNPSGPRFHK